MTRGIRNNNPLNIRKGSNWKGLSKVQSDKDFCQFDDVIYGIRAALVVLRTYAYKYKLHSLVRVISRFAPLADGNNVENYCYLVRCNWKAVLPTNDPYRNASNDTFVNIWRDKKHPKAMVYFLLRAMCLVESNFVLDHLTYEKAVALL